MSEHTGKETLQEKMEKNVFLLLIIVAITVSIGGIVTIVPLFYLDSTYEDSAKSPEIDSVRPYTPLELAGRDIYIREGCYLCHSQMVRPFRDEKERYGHYSLAVESKYDHPFQWGSKRTGPDLARVGGKYSDEWHYKHLLDPKSVVPESIMPTYGWLKDAKIKGADVQAKVAGMKMLGVPYTDEDINNAIASTDGKTELVALVTYLQSLGTMIKFEEGKDYRD